MTVLANKIRFVHFNPENGWPRRFTAAYHRDEEAIVFAWGDLYHKDTYVRSIGREVAERRLVENLDEIFAREGSAIDSDKNIGIIRKADLLKRFDKTLADHVVEKMTLMDLKHAFVGAIIASAINDIKTAQEY